MKQTLILPHKFPGLNDYQKACRTHWSKGAAMKKQWTDTVIQEVWAAKLKPMEKAFISFVWIEQTDKRDPDNIIFAKKFILDGLVSAGVLKGDRWKNIKGVSDEWKIGERYEVLVVLDDKEV